MLWLKPKYQQQDTDSLRQHPVLIPLKSLCF